MRRNEQPPQHHHTTDEVRLDQGNHGRGGKKFEMDVYWARWKGFALVNSVIISSWSFDGSFHSAETLTLGSFDHFVRSDMRKRYSTSVSLIISFFMVSVIVKNVKWDIQYTTYQYLQHTASSINVLVNHNNIHITRPQSTIKCCQPVAQWQPPQKENSCEGSQGWHARSNDCSNGVEYYTYRYPVLWYSVVASMVHTTTQTAQLFDRNQRGITSVTKYDKIRDVVSDFILLSSRKYSSIFGRYSSIFGRDALPQ